MCIGWAHASPKKYTRMLSHVMVTVELAAMITPIIALGNREEGKQGWDETQSGYTDSMLWKHSILYCYVVIKL